MEDIREGCDSEQLGRVNTAYSRDYKSSTKYFQAKSGESGLFRDSAEGNLAIIIEIGGITLKSKIGKDKCPCQGLI